MADAEIFASMINLKALTGAPTNLTVTMRSYDGENPFDDVQTYGAPFITHTLTATGVDKQNYDERQGTNATVSSAILVSYSFTGGASPTATFTHVLVVGP